MFVEQVLTERLGDVGKKLHTARSRNDQVALDIRMYLRGEIDQISDQIRELIAALIQQAEEHADTIMPGYTHLQRAQPITFGHHLMAYAMMLLRDLDRMKDCRKRMNLSPIGCCALAGTTYDTDRHFEAQKLGFDGICRNSLDDDALEPIGRRNDSLVQLGIPVCGALRCLYHRILHNAAKEKPRYGRAGPG